MSDWIFAFFHLFLLLAVFGYALVSLGRGRVDRFLIIVLLLSGYYFLVLHKAVRKEIARRKELKKKKP